MQNGRNNYRRDDNRDNSHRHERHSNNQRYNNRNVVKKYSKGLILLKSTVFMMFIVLVTLAAAFMIIKNKKPGFGHHPREMACKKQSAIKISGGVDEIAVDRGTILLLSKENKGKQELINLDPCGVERSRIILQNN